MDELLNFVGNTIAVVFFILLFIVLLIMTFTSGHIIFRIFGAIFVISIPVLLIIMFLVNRNIKNNIRLKKFRNNKVWFSGELDKFLGEELLQLRLDTIKLIRDIDFSDVSFSDYSFILLPVAKAFEGFLKKILVNLKLIKLSDLKTDPYIAINKYFNPKDGLINEYLVDKKRDKTLPSNIFSVYQECRNDILHYDLHRNIAVYSLDQAEFYYDRIEDAIGKCYIALILYKKKKEPQKLKD